MQSKSVNLWVPKGQNGHLWGVFLPKGASPPKDPQTYLSYLGARIQDLVESEVEDKGEDGLRNLLDRYLPEVDLSGNRETWGRQLVDQVQNLPQARLNEVLRSVQKPDPASPPWSSLELRDLKGELDPEKYTLEMWVSEIEER